MDEIEPFRHRPLLSRRRRLRLRLRALRNFLTPSHRVRLVEIGGYRCKRVSFRDSWLAERTARNLERFSGTKLFPQLILHFENELFVEFVDGTAIQTFGEEHLPPLVSFFTALYSTDAKARPGHGSNLLTTTHRDLDFLRDVDALPRELVRDVKERAAALLPDTLFFGYDYEDALARNFISTPSGEFVGVDVEALRDDRLLGGGVAKTLMRGSLDLRRAIYRHFEVAGLPHIAKTLPFVEIAFLANWTKRSFLKRRARNIDPQHFVRVLQ